MRSPVTRLLRWTAGGLAAGVVVAVAMSAAGRGVRPWLVAVLVTAAVAALGTAVVLFFEQVPPPPPRPDPLDTPGTVVGDRYVTDLMSLERSLEVALTDPVHFERRVRPLLADLAIERLRSQHGIDPSTEPDRARALLGESLWQTTTSRSAVRTPPKPAQLSEWVERIRAM